MFDKNIFKRFWVLFAIIIALVVICTVLTIRVSTKPTYVPSEEGTLTFQIRPEPLGAPANLWIVAIDANGYPLIKKWLNIGSIPNENWARYSMQVTDNMVNVTISVMPGQNAGVKMAPIGVDCKIEWRPYVGPFVKYEQHDVYEGPLIPKCDWIRSQH